MFKKVLLYDSIWVVSYVDLLVLKALLQVLVDVFVLDFSQEGHVAHSCRLFLDALLEEVGLLWRVGLFLLGCLCRVCRKSSFWFSCGMYSSSFVQHWLTKWSNSTGPRFTMTVLWMRVESGSSQGQVMQRRWRVGGREGEREERGECACKCVDEWVSDGWVMGEWWDGWKTEWWMMKSKELNAGLLLCRKKGTLPPQTKKCSS